MDMKSNHYRNYIHKQKKSRFPQPQNGPASWTFLAGLFQDQTGLVLFRYIDLLGRLATCRRCVSGPTMQALCQTHPTSRVENCRSTSDSI